jgi:rubredoxin
MTQAGALGSSPAVLGSAAKDDVDMCFDCACPTSRTASIQSYPSYKRRSFTVTSTTTSTWMCLICGWIYDEAAGAPEHGIAAGTLWADVPMNWTCPECGARKEDFEMVAL